MLRTLAIDVRSTAVPQKKGQPRRCSRQRSARFGAPKISGRDDAASVNRSLVGSRHASSRSRGHRRVWRMSYEVESRPREARGSRCTVERCHREARGSAPEAESGDADAQSRTREPQARNGEARGSAPEAESGDADAQSRARESQARNGEAQGCAPETESRDADAQSRARES